MAYLSIVLPTSDLRGEAKSYQRDKNHTTKWKNGAVAGPGKTCPHLQAIYDQACSDCAQRPFKSNRATWGTPGPFRKRATKEANRALHANRNILNYDVDDIRGDLEIDSDHSFEVDDVQEASAAPKPSEVEVMYSFDARTGPSHGEHVLSYAITKAMHRFENNETEKLVRKEYDVVEDSKVVADGYEAEIDSMEYDFIDHDQLE